MYHYVQKYNENSPFFKFLDFENFKKQLDFFDKEFGFVDKECFINSFQNKKIPQGVILTFDDGLKCHYEYVYKELKKRNLWGIFYVSTSPLVSKTILDVHMIHILLGKVNDKDLFFTLKDLMNNLIADEKINNDFKKLTYKTQKNSNYTLFIKRALNYFVPYSKKKEILNSLFDEFSLDVRSISKNYYMNIKEIKEMHDNEMIIGSHTHDHPVMSRLNYKDQKFQIESSFNFLENHLGKLKVKTFCYPYGGFHSFNSDTKKLLKENKCVFSFNVEQRDILQEDIEIRANELPRFDCNQFRHGKIS